MKIDRVIKVGLFSAFSFSATMLTSCDGSSGGGDDGAEVFPDSPKAGDVIRVNGSGGPTLYFVDHRNLLYVTDSNPNGRPAEYTYAIDGSRNVLDLTFDASLEGDQAVIALNQSIANPGSSLNDLIFSNKPTDAELNFFVKAVENSGINVIMEFDDDFNLFIQDSFSLRLPRSGEGTVEKIISGEGIKLILGNGGKLVAVQTNNSVRRLKFKYRENAGVTYTIAP